MQVGDSFPTDTPVYTSDALDLDPLSYTFGRRVQIMGLISHRTSDMMTDGRIFTGRADFLEHDQVHAFFNLSKSIAGTPADWQKARP